MATIWKAHGPTPWRNAKAGLVTTDLVPLDDAPRPLFDALDRERPGALMAAINARLRHKTGFTDH
ncbi:hypothetical protein [Methylobacterium sp. 17Sr1-1]|uniref:hypothetical protein n=1 Tax=Methylobacterium sp. 17Sr1-1 TaxID=2202826 RepID=UPI00194E056D|nr:hypothetical protein [Methylobacterium sp. 17Sr1-1]